MVVVVIARWFVTARLSQRVPMPARLGLNSRRHWVDARQVYVMALRLKTQPRSGSFVKASS